MSTSPARTDARPGSPGPRASRRAAKAIFWLSVVSVVTATLMAIAHAGVTIPVVSAIGPEGNRAIWPAVVVFGLGAVVFAVIAFGAARTARWTWPLAVAANAFGALSMVQPFRGVGSALGLVLFGITLVVLLSPAGRRAFR